MTVELYREKCVLIAWTSRRSVSSADRSFDVSTTLEAFVDVFLKWKNIPTVRVAFLLYIPGPLLTVGPIPRQAFDSFQRMLPQRRATACHAHQDTARPEERDVTLKKSEYSHCLNRPSRLIEQLQQD